MGKRVQDKPNSVFRSSELRHVSLSRDVSKESKLLKTKKEKGY